MQELGTSGECDSVPIPPFSVTSEGSEFSARHPAMLEPEAHCATLAAIEAGVHRAAVAAAAAHAVDRGDDHNGSGHAQTCPLVAGCGTDAGRLNCELPRP